MSARIDTNAHSAFCRPLSVEEVPPEGLDLTVSATEAERAAIAAQDGLESLAKLEGSLHVAPWRDDGLAVSGEMRARITQICVVTLEPFDSEIAEPIEVKFAPETAPAGSGAVAHLSGKAARTQRRRPPLPAAATVKLDEPDPPDPIVDGRVDLGALLSEFLALSLDPYPRKPGVAFVDPPVVTSDTEESPFAKLEALKGKLARRS